MRPIDADALLEKTIALARSFESNEDMLFYGKNKYIFKGVAYANHYISEAPTIDAVPVVRCKDCHWCKKHPTSDKVNVCTNESWNTEYYTLVTDDDFCSFGERRSND